MRTMAIGVYNQKCIWQKKETTRNKLNEIIETEPIELNCSQSVEKVYVRDERGERLVYKAVFNFEDTRVQEGDYINGFIVTATHEGIGIDGTLLTYKVVVDNA